MKKVRITAVRKVCHDDLIKMYENPMEHPCSVCQGQVFVANGVGKARRLVRECVDFDVAFRYDAGLWRREYLRRLDEEPAVGHDFVQRRFPPC